MRGGSDRRREAQAWKDWREIPEREFEHFYSQEFETLNLSIPEIIAQIPPTSSSRKRGYTIPNEDEGRMDFFQVDVYNHSEPVLKSHEEHTLFRNLNYLRWQAAGYRDLLLADPKRPNARELAEKIRVTLEAAIIIRNRIINSNLGAVVVEVRRSAGKGFTPDELFNEGAMVLFDAVRAFDFQRGIKFSTYVYSSLRRILVARLNRRY